MFVVSNQFARFLTPLLLSIFVLIMFLFVRLILVYVLPLLIAFQASYNYYWDYVATSLNNDCTEEVYDFIVGEY